MTLVAIIVGGILGALARAGLWAVFPHPAGGFDWTTLGINTGGCALIGALMVTITEIRRAPRLTGPFLGVGVLGGFTSFSAYVVDAQKSLLAGAPLTALAYLAATPVLALLAVAAGMTCARRLAAPVGPGANGPQGHQPQGRQPTGREPTGQEPR